MRKVVTPQQVAHLFANQLQDEARTQTGNLYFHKDKIYSYGNHFCIAKFDGDVLLFTERGYSNTTAKHLSVVSSATSDKDRVYCAYPTGTHTDNFTYWLEDAENISSKLKNARKPEIYISQLEYIKQKANKYAKHFGLSLPLTLDKVLNITNKDEIVEYMQTKQKLIDAENKRIKKQKAKEHATELKLWKSFKKQSLYLRNGFDYLRKDAENFETSQGVKIPIAVGLHFYSSILNYSVKVGDKFLDFTIKEINNKHIKIGCHTITLKEISKIVK